MFPDVIVVHCDDALGAPLLSNVLKLMFPAVKFPTWINPPDPTVPKMTPQTVIPVARTFPVLIPVATTPVADTAVAVPVVPVNVPVTTTDPNVPFVTVTLGVLVFVTITFVAFIPVTVSVADDIIDPVTFPNVAFFVCKVPVETPVTFTVPTVPV
ncbi:hypothetical protein EB077_07285, partial [bacterium]|nr:hypothetical protein [bacterium]